MSLAVLAGALVGFGGWLLLRGMRPAQPSLADALASLRHVPTSRPIVAPTGRNWTPLARLGAPLVRTLARYGGPTLGLSEGVRGDLRVLGRSGERTSHQGRAARFGTRARKPTLDVGRG